jgi:hypothetical protein
MLEFFWEDRVGASAGVMCHTLVQRAGIRLLSRTFKCGHDTEMEALPASMRLAPCSLNEQYVGTHVARRAAAAWQRRIIQQKKTCGKFELKTIKLLYSIVMDWQGSQSLPVA